MSEIKIPSTGRIVHFFPDKSDAHCRANGAEKLPAIVVQDWQALTINLRVFTMNADGPNVLRYSVVHKSLAAKDQDGNFAQSYWDWPEIK